MRSSRKRSATIYGTGIGIAMIILAVWCIFLFSEKRAAEARQGMAETAAEEEVPATAGPGDAPRGMSPEEAAAAALTPEEEAWRSRGILVVHAVSSEDGLRTDYYLNGAPASDRPALMRLEELVYNGRHYKRNTAVKPILLMGVDRHGDLQEKAPFPYGGQSDGILVIAHNTARNSVKLLQIPRDAMASVELRDENEEIYDVQFTQITLAYSNGDGRESSCRYMEKAVSDYLGGLEFSGYMAGGIDLISRLNDRVGGVTVTIETDGLTAFDPSFVKGATVHLEGAQAERFVRSRDTGAHFTAYTRLDRQKQYIEAFRKKLIEESSRRDGVVMDLFESVEGSVITDMDKGTYLKAALDALEDGGNVGDASILRVPGKQVEGSRYEEFYADYASLDQVLLDLFYRESDR